VEGSMLTDFSYTKINAAFPWSKPPTTTATTTTTSTTTPTTTTTTTTVTNTSTTTTTTTVTTTNTSTTTATTSSTNVSNVSGDSMTEVQKVEVVQTVTAEFTLGNATVNETAFKDELAASMGIDASSVEVTVGYKVKVAYAFASEVSAEDVKQAIAEANNVSVSQVSVNITAARLLADSRKSPRRLAGITAAAEITVDDAATAKSVETSASEGARVAAALDTPVAVTVAQAPRAVVELTARATVLVDPGEEDSVPSLSGALESSEAVPEVTVTSSETTQETRTVQVEQDQTTPRTVAGLTSLAAQAAPAWALALCTAVATAMSCE